MVTQIQSKRSISTSATKMGEAPPVQLNKSVDGFDRTQFKSELNMILKRQLSMPAKTISEILRSKNHVSSETSTCFQITAPAKKLSDRQIKRIAEKLGIERDKFHLNNQKPCLHLPITRKDIDVLTKMDREQLCRAYFDSIAVTKGYCTMVDDSSVIGKNSRQYLQEYIEYKKTHSLLSPRYLSELSWMKKNYAAATAGGHLGSDLKTLKQAERFAGEIIKLGSITNNDIQTKMQKIISKGKNPTISWLALQCALDEISKTSI